MSEKFKNVDYREVDTVRG